MHKRCSCCLLVERAISMKCTPRKNERTTSKRVLADFRNCLTVFFNILYFLWFFGFSVCVIVLFGTMLTAQRFSLFGVHEHIINIIGSIFGVACSRQARKKLRRHGLMKMFVSFALLGQQRLVRAIDTICMCICIFAARVYFCASACDKDKISK